MNIVEEIEVTKPDIAQAILAHNLSNPEFIHRTFDSASCNCWSQSKPVWNPSGNTCHNCGGGMVRTGSCETCTECGETGGCG